MRCLQLGRRAYCKGLTEEKAPGPLQLPGPQRGQQQRQRNGVDDAQPHCLPVAAAGTGGDRLGVPLLPLPCKESKKMRKRKVSS